MQQEGYNGRDADAKAQEVNESECIKAGHSSKSLGFIHLSTICLALEAETCTAISSMSPDSLYTLTKIAHSNPYRSLV
jgi:hypothetical protein